MPAPSQNHIISILSDRVGQPFNAHLQEELKTVINNKRSKFMHRLLEQHPEQRDFFTQRMVVPLTEVDDPEECGDGEEACTVLRTKYPIPTPIRSSFGMFDFVGSADFREPYGEMSPEFLGYNACNPYTSKRPKWFYQDYIYVYNSKTIKNLGIRGVFHFPEDINKCGDPDKAPCFSPDSPYPIAQDLIDDIIRDILSVELRNMFPEIGEVKVDQKEDINYANEA